LYLNANQYHVGEKFMLAKEEIRSHIFPWLVSAFISSAATFALLILFILFPGVREYVTVGDDSLFYMPIFGASAPFRGTPLTFVIWASWIYHGLGLGLSLFKWHPIIGGGWRSTMSNISLSSACTAFFAIIPLLSVIWALAFKDWDIAIGSWSIWEGNHGPWHRLYHLRRLLDYTLLFPIASSFLGILSMIFEPKKLAVMTLLGNFLLWLLLMITHYWLID
jgi:hypothetical protein